jgi:acetolactate synthase-1/2/3 large subunit
VSDGATHLAQALLAEGVDTLFGYPGGAILPFYDALRDTEISHILCRHEQAAALAAGGYARCSGKVGVCVATSGPGATNLLTGIADAWLDSVPLVALTGQVPTAMMGQDAFQEVDMVGMTMPIVKHSFLVRRAEDMAHTIREAFRIARSGRPGPVLVDLPKDALLGEAGAWRDAPRTEESPSLDLTELSKALTLLAQAQRPLIYGGGGIRLGEATEAFRTLVDATGCPTVLTLQGLGALAPSHPQNLGMLGMHGLKAANLAVQQCDPLIVCGARFDDRVTGKLDAFAPDARVIHLDIDRSEFGKRRRPDATLAGSLRDTLAALTPRASWTDRIGWASWCRETAARAAWRYDAPGPAVYAPRFLRKLSEALPARAVVSCDVGQHQMWVAQHMAFDHPRDHLTSGGLGTMGFGMPAAMGVAFARPDDLSVLVSGDGSFQMNLQELATIAARKLPIKMVLLDNQSLGMVRQWQELFLQGRYSEVDLSDNPDFCRLAEAFGIRTLRLAHADQEQSAIEALLAEPGPCLLHVLIDTAANVWPMVPPGGANHEMLEEPCTT